MKFAFYVSNNATRLKNYLLKYAEYDINKNIQFVLIDNVKNFELKTICENMHIDYFEVDITNKNEKNKFISDLFLEYLCQYKVNYAFVFADKILKGDLLVRYKNKLVNFHPSLLPSHKGLCAIDQALSKHTFLLGNSAHLVTEKVDEGNVIMQNIFPSVAFKTYDEILDKQLIMILQLMHWIEEDRLIIDSIGRVKILNATYSVSEYIPNIEIIDKEEVK